MQKVFIRDFKEGLTVDSVFLCSHKALLFGKNNKSYVNLKLLDKTGWVESRIWDQAEGLAKQFEKSDYVRAKGRVVRYQDHLQFNVFDIQRLDPREIDTADFMPASRKDIPQMYRELLQLCREEMRHPWIQPLVLGILEDTRYREDFQRAPAAKTHHHAWIGGLLEHVLALCKLAKSVLPHYPKINPDLVYAGLILHDFGKIEELRSDQLFEYSDRGRLVGHLIISVEILLRKAAATPGFPDKILQHLEHIILSHHGRLEYGSPKLPMTLEALMVSHLDDLDSKIQGFCDLVARDGESDPAWTSMNALFQRPLYKRTLQDLEEPVSGALPRAPEAETRKRPSFQEPLTSNLGDLLQKTLNSPQK